MAMELLLRYKQRDIDEMFEIMVSTKHSTHIISFLVEHKADLPECIILIIILHGATIKL